MCDHLNNFTIVGNHLRDCLTYITSPVLSTTKLQSNENVDEGIMTPLEGRSDNPYVIPPLTPENGPADGLVVIKNISVKDGCVIAFMLSLWFYSMLLMFRYLNKIKTFTLRNKLL